MLKKIKSTYFTKLIFAYVDEKQKLKIIKFNKNLQKLISISIINYKYFKISYIIYESNGNGKEYGLDDRLIFEGEYLNGKRHGKGKEYYYSGELLFEGEYLDGKRNGKGKEYSDDNSIFKGEYLNDKEWIGTRYDENGNILYKLNNNQMEKEMEEEKNIGTIVN